MVTDNGGEVSSAWMIRSVVSSPLAAKELWSAEIMACSISAPLYASAAAETPGLALVLAPRHPERVNEVLSLIASRGLTAVQQRLRGAPEVAIIIVKRACPLRP